MENLIFGMENKKDKKIKIYIEKTGYISRDLAVAIINSETEELLSNFEPQDTENKKYIETFLEKMKDEWMVFNFEDERWTRDEATGCYAGCVEYKVLKGEV